MQMFFRAGSGHFVGRLAVCFVVMFQADVKGFHQLREEREPGPYRDVVNAVCPEFLGALHTKESKGKVL